ncbi:hypothetical protein D5086_012253 [Populus alba]|uniref:Uncharacterized protein n=1 Tax=Populus alba TaxID=43335 RepID=A0ACC4C2C1_POPAL
MRNVAGLLVILTLTGLPIILQEIHGGLEDKGLEIFDEMVEGNDEVEAEIEHYGRMEDVRNVRELMMEKASCDGGDWKKLD